MITKAYILEISSSKNKFLLSIPIFEKPGTTSDNSKSSNTLFEATLSHEPTSNQSYNVGDCVFVGFENNELSRPVIIGKLFTLDEITKTKSVGALDSKSLYIQDKAVLPADTTIGDVNFLNMANFFKSINDTINKKDLFVNSVQFYTQNDGAGLVTFSDAEGVAEISLSPNVTMGVGIDTVLKVYNDSGVDLVDGQVVYRSGVIVTPDANITKVKLAIANDYAIASETIGIVTEPIPAGGYGFITRQGYVGGLFVNGGASVGQTLYLSPTVAGAFTTTKPVAPNFVTKVGYINKVSTGGTDYDGQIYVEVVVIPIASDISYNNQIITDPDFQLESQNVQAAIDELQMHKADIDMLKADINLYRTVTDADISGYRKLVTSITDPAYPNPEIFVNTPVLTGQDMLLVSAIADANLFIGAPGEVSVTSIGQVRKYDTNPNRNAKFYFKIYKRDSVGNETLLSTSNYTDTVSSNDWREFTATALVSMGTWGSTDRLVVKSYASWVDVASGEFQFKYGGATPFRIIVPVPVSVIPTPLAIGIFTDVSQFNHILSWQDTNVQKALETLDEHTHPLPIATDTILGGIKVGDRLSITVDGVLSADAVTPSFTDATINNSATTTVPLTVTALASTTANYQEWKVDTSIKALIGPAGIFNDSNITIGSVSQRTPYDAGIAYAVGSVVSYTDKIYICRRITTAGTLPTNTTYWVEIGLDSRKNAIIGPSDGATIWNNGNDLVLEADKGNLNFVGLGNVPLRIFSHIATAGGIQSGAYVPFHFNVLSTTEQAIGAFSDYTGSAWRARGTSVGLIKFETGAWNITSETGKSIGGTYTPTSRLYIASDGKVGIGTATPSHALQISEGTVGTKITFHDVPYGMGYVATGETGVFANNDYASAKVHLGMQDATTFYPKLTVLQSGRVGIGTTTPASALHIADNGNDILTVGNKTTPAKQVIVGFNAVDNYGYIQAIEQSVAYRNLLLNSLGGNVGIGTSTPSSKLSVKGEESLLNSAQTKRLFIRYDDTWDAGVIGSIQDGVTYKNTLINPDSGKVGIGNTNPGSLLSVGPASDVGAFSVQGLSSGGYIVSFRDSDGENIFNSSGTLLGNNLLINIGDNAGVQNGTSLTIDDGNNKIILNGDVGINVASPSAKLDVGGNLRHQGLTMTTGTNIDQYKETKFTSALTTSWTDVTGVSGTYLATGSYIVQILSNGEYYSGNMAWFSGTTTSTIADEIMLHRAGPTASAGRIYARIIRQSGSPSVLKLQVSGSTTIASHEMTFTFRRTM